MVSPIALQDVSLTIQATALSQRQSFATYKTAASTNMSTTLSWNVATLLPTTPLANTALCPKSQPIHSALGES